MGGHGPECGVSARVRAEALLSRLPDGPVIGAEVGVHDGRMSERLLARPGLTLVMVDVWDVADERYVASGDPRAAMSAADAARAKRRALERTEFAKSRRIIAHARSLVAAHALARGSLDFVFIDADHSEEAVREDIEAWREKVKPGGMLGGHDYGHPDFPGVRQSVDDLVGTVEVGPDRTWWVRL